MISLQYIPYLYTVYMYGVGQPYVFACALCLCAGIQKCTFVCMLCLCAGVRVCVPCVHVYGCKGPCLCALCSFAQMQVCMYVCVVSMCTDAGVRYCVGVTFVSNSLLYVRCRCV